jgi:hypothetical protein
MMNIDQAPDLAVSPESFKDDGEDSIDIQFTDYESDSEFSETESDKAFIVPDEERLDFGEVDLSYGPHDVDDSSEDSSASSLVGFSLEHWGFETNKAQIGPCR